MGDYGTVLWAAERTIAMHAPSVIRPARMDPHARWRDLLQPEGATTYRVGRCPCCGEDGCELLDADRQMTTVVESFLNGDGDR